MRDPEREDPYLDDDAGRLVRPYTVSNGRTRPTAAFDLLTLVMATGRGRSHNYLGPDHSEVLGLCKNPITVAEIAAHIKMPAAVTKVLLSDLVDSGAVTTREPVVPRHDSTDRDLLEAVLHGLRKRL
ncbi:DUF742 domain-containing protein [Streptomyces sp. YIM 98790]|uniref:DUF742 domain-containing protein n=1 Tax=Streptomyces sp. YIM 98790 TaxID=2689077 RepID=UPI0014098BD6|nr:DUF742 domain-containing protein [Streptomyces sp. YIM 98790]